LRILVDLDVVTTSCGVRDDTVTQHHPDVTRRKVGVQTLLQDGHGILCRNALAAIGSAEMICRRQGEYLPQVFTQLPQALAVTAQPVTSGTIELSAARPKTLRAPVDQQVD